MASQPTRKAVLVTGCSSGIGRAVAIYLAGRGFTALATVRKQIDADGLRATGLPDLVPICPLDLALPAHMPGAVETVKRELAARQIDGLYAIVNNAGGGCISPVELMDLNVFRTELETRVVGPMALVQALLPLIRQAHGRILWIATPGMIAIPYVSSIHAPEFAMNCIAHSLHLELMPWKVPNILICCGGIKTPAADRTAQELEATVRSWSPEQQALYGQTMQRLQTRLARFDAGRSEPEVVGKAVFRALVARRPRRRYAVGSGARAMNMLRFLPQPVIDAIFSRLA